MCAFCLSEPPADTLENSLNPDQARQIIEPDHDPNCFILFLLELGICSTSAILESYICFRNFYTLKI